VVPEDAHKECQMRAKAWMPYYGVETSCGQVEPGRQQGRGRGMGLLDGKKPRCQRGWAGKGPLGQEKPECQRNDVMDQLLW
jgi:hypothetical protein